MAIIVKYSSLELQGGDNRNGRDLLVIQEVIIREDIVPYDPSHIRSAIESRKAKQKELIVHQQEILLLHALEEIRQAIVYIEHAHSVLVGVVKELE